MCFRICVYDGYSIKRAEFSYSFLQFCSFGPKAEAPLFVDGIHGVGALNQNVGLLGSDVVVRYPRGETMF